jgi:hypothetical protein
MVMSGSRYVWSVACALVSLGAGVWVSGAGVSGASAQGAAPGGDVVWPDPPGVTRPAAPPTAAPRPPRPPRAAQSQSAPAAALPAPAPAPEVVGPDAIFEDEVGNTDPAAAKPPRAPRPPVSAATGAGVSNIRCDGAFGKDTSHARLASLFGAKNVVFQPVDGPEGSKMNATVIFPNDPKRRIEVLWHDENARKKPATIVIGPQSTWRARGFRIGERIDDVERVNGKPFKMSGFDWTYGGAARDWQGGKLENLSGGCRLGMRFEADPNAPGSARDSLTGNREFASDDPGMRAVTPKIVELIVGYPQ